MQRIATYGLIAIYLMVNTPLHQLSKLPALIEHFAEHSATNPDCTFLSFLAEHYVGKAVHDEDHDKDMKLPFKKYEVNSGNVYAVLPATIVHEESSFPFTEGKRIIRNEHPLNQLRADSFFQPPCFG